jgi:hypothetical protein
LQGGKALVGGQGSKANGFRVAKHRCCNCTAYVYIKTGPLTASSVGETCQGGVYTALDIPFFQNSINSLTGLYTSGQDSQGKRRCGASAGQFLKHFTLHYYIAFIIGFGRPVGVSKRV